MLFWPTTLRRLDVIAKTCVAFADAVATSATKKAMVWIAPPGADVALA